MLYKQCTCLRVTKSPSSCPKLQFCPNSIFYILFKLIFNFLGEKLDLPSQVNALSLLSLYPSLQEHLVAVRFSHSIATEFRSHTLPLMADVMHLPNIYNLSHIHSSMSINNQSSKGVTWSKT